MKNRIENVLEAASEAMELVEVTPEKSIILAPIPYDEVNRDVKMTIDNESFDGGIFAFGILLKEIPSENGEDTEFKAHMSISGSVTPQILLIMMQALDEGKKTLADNFLAITTSTTAEESEE